MQVIRHNTAAEFLARAKVWLERAEAENNLILGIARFFESYLRPVKVWPYFLTVEDNETIVGAALMTPPRRLLITRMPDLALSGLADYLLKGQAPVPGVNGPKTEADFFAECWANTTSKRSRLKMSQRIHTCERVASLSPCSGFLRIATMSDESLLTDWAGEFCRDAKIEDDAAYTKSQIPVLIAKKWLYVWEDREVVSMADLGRETTHGFSLSLVYTPPRWRNKGYASSCVAALTQRMLDSGKQFCCLYTDLSNPTSNRIYQKIGYQPVCDVQDWIFE